VLSTDIFDVAVDAAGLCCISLNPEFFLICNLFASFLSAVTEILGEIFPFNMLLCN
jgi:hypothetical protein